MQQVTSEKRLETVGIWLFGLLCSAFHFEQEADNAFPGNSWLPWTVFSVDPLVCHPYPCVEKYLFYKWRAGFCSQIIICFSLNTDFGNGCVISESPTLGEFILRPLQMDPCWAFDDWAVAQKRRLKNNLFHHSMKVQRDIFEEQSVISLNGIGPNLQH